MRLGIDFGTTRTRVAAVIKGNYPLITFQADTGDGADWYPSLIAAREDQLAFGLEAQAVQYEPGWEVLSSFKRLLSDASPHALWKVGKVELPVIEWLTRFFRCLRQDLTQHSNLEVGRRERFEVMAGIPANANSNQRFLTLEALRQAGFHVIGMLNEPSAAGIEYAHRYRRTDLTGRREYVVVYDLGGGTFDVAVILMAGNQHEVIACEGISRLGGDDLDAALLELAEADPAFPAMGSEVPRRRLLHLCREVKESIHPNSRKIVVDFGQIHPELGEAVVPVAEFYEKCAPLILQTIHATEAAMQTGLGSANGDNPSLASVYLVGGSCELPVLARSLRDRFGRRVRRSPYPPAATAIGLAIAADEASGYILQERFTRHFGVWREGESGQRVVFDPIFTKETGMPHPGQPPLIVRRRYYPVHNIGRFRFLECSALNQDGEPGGDMLSWKEVVFPLDPRFEQSLHVERLPVERASGVESNLIEEVYQCDAAGVIGVTIANLTAGYSRTFRIR
jgi:molecular chaperone DnaK (HSP70)